MNGATNHKFWNFLEYQFKGNYNRCCNFPNSDFVRTSLNNNIKLKEETKQHRRTK